MAGTEWLARARANGSSARQFVPPGGTPTNVDEIIELMLSAKKSGHTVVRLGVKVLFAKMAGGPWRVTAGRHRGGRGGAGRPPDENDHITLSVGDEGYHLHVTPDGHLRRVTGDNGVDVLPPYVPPGAAPPALRP
jgi:hypothetical protein